MTMSNINKQGYGHGNGVNVCLQTGVLIVPFHTRHQIKLVTILRKRSDNTK